MQGVVGLVDELHDPVSLEDPPGLLPGYAVGVGEPSQHVGFEAEDVGHRNVSSGLMSMRSEIMCDVIDVISGSRKLNLAASLGISLIQRTPGVLVRLGDSIQGMDVRAHIFGSLFSPNGIYVVKMLNLQMHAGTE